MTCNRPVEILLVEDNPVDLELTMRALKKLQLANAVQVARDGEQALACIFGEGNSGDVDLLRHPKLILLDIRLPKIDGHEVLRQIKADERTKMIPVVMLTSSQQEKDRLMSYNSGVNSYIVKPVTYDKFIDAISKLGLYWLLLNEPPV